MSYLHRIYDTINIKNSRVGLGTTTPTELLHVEGNIYSSGTLTASNLSIIGDFTVLNTTTSNTEQMVVTNNGTGPALKVTQTGVGSQFSVAEFYDNETGLAMKIADTGLVGIGTASPTSRLHVYDSSTNAYTTVEATSTNAAQVKMVNGAGTTLIGPSSSSNVQFTTTAAQPIHFGTNNTTRMVIGSAGSIGIGTLTPVSDLHVYDATADALTTIQATSTNAAQVQLINGGGTTVIGPSSSAVQFKTTAVQPIEFGTSNTTRMVIASNGSVGIGTTSPQYALDVRGSAINFAAPIIHRVGSMVIVQTCVGNQSYSTTGSHHLGIRAQWANTTTDNKLTFRVTAKFHIASDTTGAFRRFESLVTPKNDSATSKPCDLVVVGTGETSGTEFTGFSNSVVRNGANSVDIRVDWTSAAQPAIGNLQVQIFANESLGDFTFTTISG